MTQRIKGQEVSLILTGPGGLEQGFGAVQSFDAEAILESSSEGYLGETTNRYDEILNGHRGNMELHLEGPEAFEFEERVIDRATRRIAAATQFNAIGTMLFPSGIEQRLLYEDLFFGPFSLSFASRSDFVQLSLEWSCSVRRRIVG